MRATHSHDHSDAMVQARAATWLEAVTRCRDPTPEAAGPLATEARSE